MTPADIIREALSLPGWTSRTPTKDALAALTELVGERDQKREAMERALKELGVPTPDYPANVANAVEILGEAL